MLMSKKMMVTLLILLMAAPTLSMAGGTGAFNFPNTVFVAGAEIKAGQYDVKWESSDPEATVEIRSKGKVVATVKGKIVEVDKKHEYDTFLAAKDTSGRDVIKQFHFGGKKTTIVFE